MKNNEAGWSPDVLVIAVCGRDSCRQYVNEVGMCGCDQRTGSQVLRQHKYESTEYLVLTVKPCLDTSWPGTRVEERFRIPCPNSALGVFLVDSQLGLGIGEDLGSRLVCT